MSIKLVEDLAEEAKRKKTKIPHITEVPANACVIICHHPDEPTDRLPFQWVTEDYDTLCKILDEKP